MGTDIHMVVQARQGEKWSDIPGVAWAWRNYDVFAILADVRNGSGLAGCDTGDGFVPIAKPRGLPNDFPKRYLGDHSFSWVTLAELLAYPWGDSRVHRGLASLSTFRGWKGSGPPAWYCGGVCGNDVRVLSPEEAAALPADVADTPYSGIYVSLEWRELISESAGGFHREFIPDLEAIAKRRGLKGDDIRLVFGFDS